MPGPDRDRLLSDLQELGVAAGDLVMVHASLRKIGLGSAGTGSGGAEALLDALDAAVGADGTLLMILGCETGQDEANRLAEPERLAMLETLPAFDPMTAPAMSEIGALAEAFRLRPGTIVNDNPSGRFGARGRLAPALLADAPWHDYYGPGSPLQLLCDGGGRILRMGADPETVTALHFSEYLAALPVKRRVRRHYKVLRGGLADIVAVECLDDEFGIVDWPGEDYFGLIVKSYVADGRARRGRVGGADSELIEAADIVGYGARWMEAHLA